MQIHLAELILIKQTKNIEKAKSKLKERRSKFLKKTILLVKYLITH